MGSSTVASLVGHVDTAVVLDGVLLDLLPHLLDRSVESLGCLVLLVEVLALDGLAARLRHGSVCR